MSKPSLRRMAQDPRFVSGIYNYCDRWCERCPLTSRCLVFARNSQEPEPQDFADVLGRVKDDFAETLAMLQEKADELGIDLSQPPDPAVVAGERAMRETVDQHPVIKSAEKYARMAGEWLAAHPGVERGASLQPAAREPGTQSFARADAIAVVQWFQYQIAVKLRRALSFEPFESQEGADAALQSDVNGSARVALIGIERSLDAWFGLLGCDSSPATVRILDHLGALRDDVDRVFPDARRFVRPGFDTGERPWPESGS